MRLLSMPAVRLAPLMLAIIVVSLTPADATLPHPIVGDTAPGPVVKREQPQTVSTDPVHTRTTTGDAPDLEPGELQTHVVYFVPLDKEDERLDASSAPLAQSISAIRAWFVRETSSEGLPAIAPRFDRRLSGSWDVSFALGNRTSAEYEGIADIAADLIEQGYTAENKRYLVYAALSLDAPGNPGGVCGESYYPLRGFSNRPFAVVYLDAASNCRARNFGGRSHTTAAHEWLHLEGITPLLARHHCHSSPFHVCTGPLWAIPPRQEPVEVPRLDPEATDIMFPLIHLPISATVLDRNRDDYLDHGLPSRDLRNSAWMESAG